MKVKRQELADDIGKNVERKAAVTF
jgi:hypothetical protein